MCRRECGVLFLLLVSVACRREAGLCPSPGACSAEALCSRADVLFCEDWEDGDHRGWDWSSAWDPCMPIANSGGYRSANALQQHIDANLAECGYPAHDIGAQSVQDAPLYMRWYVKFGPGYVFLDWTDQKNNYFVARVNDQITWRMMLGLRAESDTERGRARIVLDALGHDPRWFYNGAVVDAANAAPELLTTDRWYCIEWAIKGNTPGRSDGWTRVWMDDRPYLGYDGQNLKSTGDPITQAPWLSSYYGGDPPGTHPAQDLWYDNLVVARQRIGCIGASGHGASPPKERFP